MSLMREDGIILMERRKKEKREGKSKDKEYLGCTPSKNRLGAGCFAPPEQGHRLVPFVINFRSAGRDSEVR